MTALPRDFARALHSVEQLERRAYRRGVRDALILAVMTIAFTCAYLYIGGAS